VFGSRIEGATAAPAAASGELTIFYSLVVPATSATATDIAAGRYKGAPTTTATDITSGGFLNRAECRTCLSYSQYRRNECG